MDFFSGLRIEGSVDLRCQSPSRCWYCLDRCDLCLNIVPFGCSRKTIQSLQAQFCSSCQNVAVEKDSMKVNLSPVSSNNLPLPVAVSPLSASHQVLLHAHCEATIDGKPFLMEFTLCSGKGSEDMPVPSAYVVYHHWNLFSQQYLEFTVTPEMSPDSPIVYTEGDGSRMAVMMLKRMPLQNILLQGIKAYNVET